MSIESSGSVWVIEGPLVRIEGNLPPDVRTVIEGYSGVLQSEGAYWIPRDVWPTIKRALEFLNVSIGTAPPKHGKNAHVDVSGLGEVVITGDLPRKIAPEWLGQTKARGLYGVTPWGLAGTLDAFRSDGIEVNLTPRAQSLLKEIDTRQIAVERALSTEPPTVELADGTLWKFQRETLAFGEATGGSFILGDEMGLGKTIQAIALARYFGVERTLIVSPAVAKWNWVDEIKRFDGRKSEVVSGTSGDFDSTKPWLIANYDILTPRLAALQSYGADLLIFDECFPQDTLIQTRSGKLTIGEIVNERLNVEVLAFSQADKRFRWRKIKRFIRKLYKSHMIKISHSYGTLTCTPNHPIWVENRGFIRADELQRGDELRVVRQSLQTLCVSHSERRPILRNVMFGKVENEGTKNQGQNLHAIFCKEAGRCEARKEESGRIEMVERKESRSRISETRSPEILGVEKISSDVPSSWRQWSIDRSSECALSSIRVAGRMDGMGSGFIRSGEIEVCLPSESLQSGHCQSVSHAGNRSGWCLPSHEEMEILGQEERISPYFSRVESIEIQERRDSDGLTECPCDNRFVYNLEVEIDHTYVANDVVVSNCHYLKNRDTKRSIAGKQLAASIPRRVLLTGTPIWNRPIDLWNQLDIVQPRWWGREFQFGVAFANGKKGRFGWEFKGSSREDILHARLNYVMLRRLKADVLKDLPPKTRTTFAVELQADARESYAKAWKGFLHWSKNKPDGEEGGESKDNGAILGKIMRLRQISSMGRISATIEMIEERVSEGKPVVVFGVFLDSLAAIKAALTQKENLRIGYVDGSVDPKKRHEIATAFQNGELDVFIGQMQAAGVAINLFRSDTTIHHDLDYSPEALRQAEDRVNRIGQTFPTHHIYLIGKDTFDEKILAAVMKKMASNQGILDTGIPVNDEILDSIRREFFT